jgi:regulator of protease activity HflC (stomatin/prohibitin superfamily)
MVFVVIAVILFLISGPLAQNFSSRLPKLKESLRVISVLLLSIGLIMTTVITIDAGFIGVKKLFGKVEPDILESGLHFVNPLYEIERFDAKTQNYTMSLIHNEGQKEGDDAIRVLSSDGLEVVIDLTVLYKVQPDKAPEIVRKIGSDYEDRIVRPITRTKIRDNAVYYDAVSLYSSKRDEFQNRIFKTIEADFKIRGLQLEQILIRNIQLPASVKASIESKINAEQEAQKMQFVLQKERQEAERKRVEAQGIADYNRIVSSELTDKQLQYETIKMQKELAQSPNSKIIIMGGKQMPMILDAK